MNKFEKIDDSMLNEVSGGTYHNIKPAAFVNVRDVPGGNTIASLGTADFVVTDGERVVVNGVTWHHVYFSRGNGYVPGYEMGNLAN